MDGSAAAEEAAGAAAGDSDRRDRRRAARATVYIPFVVTDDVEAFTFDDDDDDDDTDTSQSSKMVSCSLLRVVSNPAIPQTRPRRARARTRSALG